MDINFIINCQFVVDKIERLTPKEQKAYVYKLNRGEKKILTDLFTKIAQGKNFDSWKESKQRTVSHLVDKMRTFQERESPLLFAGKPLPLRSLRRKGTPLASIRNFFRLIGN